MRSHVVEASQVTGRTCALAYNQRDGAFAGTVLVAITGRRTHGVSSLTAKCPAQCPSESRPEPDERTRTRRHEPLAVRHREHRRDRPIPDPRDTREVLLDRWKKALPRSKANMLTSQGKWCLPYPEESLTRTQGSPSRLWCDGHIDRRAPDACERVAQARSGQGLAYMHSSPQRTRPQDRAHGRTGIICSLIVCRRFSTGQGHARTSRRRG